MRNIESRAQHIANAMARPHRHARRQRPHRQPGAQLAIQPRIEITIQPVDA